MARARKQKSEFVSAAGTVFELVKALADEVRGLGGSDDDLRRVLSQPPLRRRVAEVIMGRERNNFPSLALAADLIPEGYEIVEDVEPSKFQVKDLELVPFLKSGEKSANGEIMRQRALGLKANLGLADAKFILDHQDELPVEFRSRFLVFTGTLLRGPDGDLSVACLYWDGDRWCLGFFWLRGGWRGSVRLLRCK